jgi:hypothetical protein
MQFSVIRTRCSVRFQDASHAIILDATWKDYVNARYRQVIASAPDWPSKELRSSALSIAAGVRSVDLPTDGWRVISVWDSTNQVKLDALDGTSSAVAVWPSGDETGQSTHYRVFSNAIQVYPLPEAAINLRVEYEGKPADLSADSDVPWFPAQYHDLLVEGALADAYNDDGNLNQAKIHEDRYMTILAQLQADLLGPREETYPHIVDDWWG